MSRVPPTPVHVLVDGEWILGTLRTYDVAGDGSRSGVVSYEGVDCTVTGRFPDSHLRTPAGGPLAPPE